MKGRQLFDIKHPEDLAKTAVGMPILDGKGGTVVGRIVACVATAHNVAITIQYLDGRQEMRKLMTDEMQEMWEYLQTLNPFTK